MNWSMKAGYERRLATLGQAIVYDARDLDVSFHCARAYLPAEAAVKQAFAPIRPGQTWGGQGDARGYFRAVACIPKEWKGRRVVVVPEAGGHGLLYIDGRCFQGIDHVHSHALLADRARGGEEFDLLLEVLPTATFWIGPAEPARFGRIALACVNADLWDFWLDATLVLQMAQTLPPLRPAGRFGVATFDNGGSRRDYQDNPRGEQCWAALERAFALVDWHALGQVGVGPANLFAQAHLPQTPQIDAARAARLARSARRARAELRPVLATRGVAGRFRLVNVPHSHLDVAWLWPLRETVRKMARTTANVLRLLDQYPAARFGQSQAVLYDYLRLHFPDVHREVARRVRQGRWELLGGQWVEADTNLTGGESLIRQFLLGQAYFRKHFGRECRVGWLPDAFGYSPNLPQILAGCGLTGFFTAKLCIDDDNQFPYSLFHWEGLDGTRVLTQISQFGYNDTVGAGQLLDAQHVFREKDRFGAALKPYGMGDGGGGPSAFEYEAEARLADVADMPRVDGATTVEEYFAEASGAADLPTWRGEMYLGAHRGTYTTQANIKKYNRLCELRLREAEMLAAITGGAKAPAFTPLWQTVCTMQFHDVLPGSSIDSVNAENIATMKACHGEIVTLRDKLAGGLAKGRGAAVFNPHSWRRADLVPADRPGRFTQTTADGPLALVEVDGLSCAPLRPVRAPFAASARADRLENARFVLKLDDAGRIVSMWDKRARRDLVAGVGRGLGNELRLHTDWPGPNAYGFNNDCWDVAEFARREFTALGRAAKVEVVERGPLRAAVRVTHRFGGSELVQDIVVYGHTDRVDFRTRVDWHEDNRMLRVRFPVPVNAESVWCEAAFGHAARPAHTNTSWEWSKFEVPCHRWADACDGGYGVALLNDCKYGYDVQRGGLSLDLLRSPSAPDPTADRGRHEFTYSFLGHEGGPLEGGVIHEAYALNAPLLPVAGAPARAGSFLAVDAPNVLIETIKPAENGRGVIARLYECANRHTHATLTGRFARVAECDMLERDRGKARPARGKWERAFRPFEIVTVRLT